MTTQYNIFVLRVSSSKDLVIKTVSAEILKVLSRENNLNKPLVFSKPMLMSGSYFTERSTDLCEKADPANSNEKLWIRLV